MNISSINRNI